MSGRSSKGGHASGTAPIAWVYFPGRGGSRGFTIRWKRGDAVAYVLIGKRGGDHEMRDVLGTIPVPRDGWTDEQQVRELGRRWVQEP